MLNRDTVRLVINGYVFELELSFYFFCCLLRLGIEFICTIFTAFINYQHHDILLIEVDELQNCWGLIFAHSKPLITVKTVRLRNALPINIRKAQTVNSFKKMVQKFSYDINE